MARIPLASVPNAVHQLSTGPLDVPRVSGQEVSASLNKVAKAGQQEEMSLDAFSGEGKGLAALGAGITNAGQDVSQMAAVQMAVNKRAAEERVRYQVLEGQAKFDAEYKGYKSTITDGTDPEQIIKGWQEQAPKAIAKVTGDKTLAPEARDKLAHWTTIRNIGLSGDLQALSNTQAFTRSKQAIMNLAEQQLDSGHLDAALSTAEQLRPLTHPGVVDELQQKFKRADESNKVEHAIAADPFFAEKMLSEKISQTGKVSDTSNLSVDQIQTYQRQVTAAQNHKRSELFGQVKDLIDLNQVRSREDIEATADGKLDTVAIDMLDARRQGKQFDPEFYSQVWKDANEYDPSKDESGAQRMSLDIRIHMLPEGMKDGPRSRLNASKAPNKELETQYSKQIGAALEAGMFGNVSKVKAKENGLEVRKPADPAAFVAAHDKAAKAQIEFHDWAKAHPKATAEEARGKISDLILKDARAKAATDTPASSHWWNHPIDSLWNSVVPQPAPADKAREILKQVVPAPAPSQTSSIPDRAKELGTQLVQNYGGRFEQWADRDVRGRPGIKSKHATGEAIDYYGSDLNAVAQQLATADKTKRVIYNHKIWDPSRGWHDYTGVDPHTDHVHIEPA